MNNQANMKRRKAHTYKSHIVGAALLMMLATGCSTVRPWQREILADEIMQPDRDPIGSALADRVYFSREAASGGRSVGGGGCGCN
ncbi:MAG TPA: DUF4266 domain-containing protein [Tepidisphaeraceae bacterium]|jgi:hypothetical protein